MSKTNKVISVILMVMLVMAMSVVATSAIVCEAPVGTTVTYTVDVTAEKNFEDVQASVTYDAAALELVRIEAEEGVEQWMVEGPVRCPNLDGVIFNAGTEGIVKFNASKVTGFDFKETKALVTLEFVVKAEGGNASIAFDEMTILGGASSYFTAGEASVTEGITVAEYFTFEPVVEPTTVAPTEAPTTVPATEAPTTVPATEAPTTVPAPATDATGATEAPATEKVDAPATGAATYIYVAMAMMAMAACAVVVLRKKANG